MNSTICWFVGNRFRIVARNRGGEVCLVGLFPTAKAARLRIKWFFEAPDERRNGRFKALWVEEWVGKPTSGRWRRLLLRNGGAYFKVEASEESTLQLTSGDVVEAVLLNQRTRRGGWNAALEAQPTIKGPVTKMGDWPANWKPGLRVKLKLCSLSKSSSRAQFAMIN